MIGFTLKIKCLPETATNPRGLPIERSQGDSVSEGRVKRAWVWDQVSWRVDLRWGLFQEPAQGRKRPVWSHGLLAAALRRETCKTVGARTVSA